MTVMRSGIFQREPPALVERLVLFMLWLGR
jgi:hypothetical protein